MIKQKGSILILVLWVLIILSLLSIAISYRASGDIKLAKYESESIKASYLAKAGVAKMIAELNRDNNNYNSLNEDWNKEKDFSFGGGRVTYKATDEEARFNLNSQNLSKEHLVRLGLDDDISQRILDYKIKKGEKGFEFIEELFLIDGMTRDVYSALEPYVAIYRGNGLQVNINTAGEKVLRALVDNEPVTNKIIEFRNGNDGRAGTEDDGIFTEANFSVVFGNFGITPEDILNYKSMFNVKSGFFRILVDVSFSEGERMIKHVISVTDRGGKIYYWKEE
ncbi:MAG: type II secretion system protein GspK [Candidatus Omnitrophota bacterium]|nr:type II secretion system protein GspK [Candidatus Omnitrophota bacterium]